MIAGHLAEDGLDFVFGEDDRQMLRLFSPNNIRQRFQLLLQDFAVKKKNSAEGLALGRGGDVFVDGKVGEEGGNFGCAHVFGMALVMEEDEAFDPIVVSVFGAPGVMFKAHSIAELSEERLGRSGHGSIRGELRVKGNETIVETSLLAAAICPGWRVGIKSGNCFP